MLKWNSRLDEGKLGRAIDQISPDGESELAPSISMRARLWVSNRTMSSASLQIRHYRNLKNISLRDLSASIRYLRHRNCRKIEFGKAKLTVETALRLAGILHVPAAMFLAEPTPQAKARRSITRSNTGRFIRTQACSLRYFLRNSRRNKIYFGKSASPRDHSKRTVDGDSILARNFCT